ncbi:MAG: hypothetical protein Q4E62_02110 [Sutterellaceae bacterium]|nr:hypothetical protein [Sutterellaceae bacterium]
MRSTETLIALKPNPEQRLGLLKLAAQVGYQLEDWNKTIQYAQDWLAAVGQTKQKTPEAASLYELKAFAENNLGKSATAVATMQIAFGIEATKNRGDFILSCWQSMQKTAEELRFLPVMIRQWPESVYWSRWGWLLYEENRQGEALNVLSAAEKTRKLDARLVPLLIDLLYSKEAYHELLRVLRANPEALPQRSMAMLQASALIQTGRRTQALDVLNAFVRTSEAKHSDIALAAQTAYAEEKWSRLRELADRLVKIEDQNREYWLILGGIACFELKDYTAAHQVFSEVQSDKWKETRRLWLNQIQFLQPEIVHHGHHAQP